MTVFGDGFRGAWRLVGFLVVRVIVTTSRVLMRMSRALEEMVNSVRL
ncbi:MAG TPA: hypothetical protein VGR30_10360 [Candidatus Binatia bacterium]|jgi:hypothetical protein|nr:hypothetical protein [Candidatus Binatia bacterium]